MCAQTGPGECITKDAHSHIGGSSNSAAECCLQCHTRTDIDRATITWLEREPLDDNNVAPCLPSHRPVSKDTYALLHQGPLVASWASLFLNFCMSVRTVGGTWSQQTKTLGISPVNKVRNHHQADRTTTGTINMPQLYMERGQVTQVSKPVQASSTNHLANPPVQKCHSLLTGHTLKKERHWGARGNHQ